MAIAFEAEATIQYCNAVTRVRFFVVTQTTHVTSLYRGTVQSPGLKAIDPLPM